MSPKCVLCRSLFMKRTSWRHHHAKFNLTEKAFYCTYITCKCPRCGPNKGYLILQYPPVGFPFVLVIVLWHCESICKMICSLTWKSCRATSMKVFRGFSTHLCMAFSSTCSVEYQASHTMFIFFFKAHAFIYQYTVLTLWGEQIYNWLWLRVASRGGERIRFTPVSTKSIFWNSADKKMKKKCHHTNVLIVCACSLCPFVGVVLTSTEGGCLCCMTKTPVSACRVWAHDDKVAVNISTAANEPNINIWGKWSHCLGLTSATFYSGFVTRNKLTCWKKC